MTHRCRGASCLGGLTSDPRSRSTVVGRCPVAAVPVKSFGSHSLRTTPASHSLRPSRNSLLAPAELPSWLPSPRRLCGCSPGGKCPPRPAFSPPSLSPRRRAWTTRRAGGKVCGSNRRRSSVGEGPGVSPWRATHSGGRGGLLPWCLEGTEWARRSPSSWPWTSSSSSSSSLEARPDGWQRRYEHGKHGA